MIKEFLDFLKKYGVLGLAIAVIIGGKVNEFVTTLVNDLFMPLIFKPLLNAAQVSDIRLLQYNGIFYGRVLGSFIDFILVALIVFLFARVVLREKEIAKK